MTDKQFDDILRQKLGRLDPPYEPASWQALRARLEAEGLSQDPQDAIRIVAERLQRLETQTGAPDWAAFAELLARAEQEDARAFDEAVREKLSHYRAGSRSEWERMHRMLEDRFTIRGRLRRYRVPEVVLFLLCLFTFFPYVQLWTPGTEWWRLPAGWFAEEAEPRAAMPEMNSSRALREGGGLQAAPPVSNPLPERTALSSASASAPVPMQIPAVAVRPAWVEARGALAARLEKKARASKRAFAPSAPSVDLLASLETAMSVLHAQGVLDAHVPAISKATSKRLYLTVVTATDVNFVVSPYDPVFGTPSDTTLAVGYGGGLLLGLQRNRWEWETGLLYTFKRYTPNTPRQLLGSLEYLIEENFDGIQLDMLQIPFHVRHNLWWHPRWHVWLHAGASAHLVLSPFYDIHYREVTPLFASVPSSEKDPGEVLEQSRLREKEFPIGLLQGGSLRDNSWLTLNLGMGLERHLSDRLSLMARPALQYDLDRRGFGPNADRLHALSLWMGVRWRID